ncbi:unnamed protein product [Ceutorhynchus assimilis]|uniref:Protein sleepless n=1 Tax=Ceutorhynchus assimilis TaxID=467358 RepID=A0A9N9MI29_9CUCU|nr:unnamed protein product [Ceutorhynchus assimilis]
MLSTTGSLVLMVMMVIGWKPGETRDVRCYLCSTRDNETACRYPESYDMPLAKCDRTALEKTQELAKKIDPSYDKIFEVDTEAMARHIDLDCLKVVTRLGNKKYIIRGCQLAEQISLDICHKMKRADTNFLKKEHCSRCSSDRCNPASNLYVDQLLLILFLCVALMH